MTMATKTFRGEGDLMVDALVAASQAAYANPNGGQPMPGFGRDLVPFFDDLGQEAGAANGAAAPAPAPQAQKKAKAPKPNKGGKKTAAVPAPKGVLTKGGMTYVQQQPNAAVAQAARTAGKSAAPAPSSNTRWAGPAFSNSPAPDALPVPSFMGGKAPAGSTALTGDAGADIMKMLGQEPPRAEAANAGHAASAPDLMAMLNIVPEPVAEPAAPAPPPLPPMHRVTSAPAVKAGAKGAPLLTPGMLAAMAGGGGLGAGQAIEKLAGGGGAGAGQAIEKRAATAIEKRAATAPRPAALAPAAPKPPPTPAAPSADFQRLLQKLESSA